MLAPDNMNLPYHPLADCFPLMSDAEFAGLCASVADAWLPGKPIIIFENKILDGRNRYRAILKERPELRTVADTFQLFSGSFEEAKSYVIKTNLNRRNHTIRQKAEIADKLANCTHGGGRHSNQDANLHLENRSLNDAAKLVGVSRRSVATVREFKRLKAEGKLKRAEIESVENGEKPYSWAVRCARRRGQSAAAAQANPTARHEILASASRKRFMQAVGMFETASDAITANKFPSALSEADVKYVKSVLRKMQAAATFLKGKI